VGRQGTPQIAIADWQDVPTLNEHEICRQYLKAAGCATILVDPRALEYPRWASVGGRFSRDIIYKRVLISEMIQRMGVDNPIVHAVATAP